MLNKYTGALIRVVFGKGLVEDRKLEVCKRGSGLYIRMAKDFGVMWDRTGISVYRGEIEIIRWSKEYAENMRGNGIIMGRKYYHNGVWLNYLCARIYKELVGIFMR